VRDGRVVGRGVHEHAARDHAEVLALREAGSAARGSTVHVSLEPCSSHGRTGPCTEALVAAGVARVVAAVPDPDPRHRGEGLRRLAAAGVETAWGGAEIRRRALVINEHFVRWRLSGRPFTTLKAACSLDGRTAAASGDSRWITGEAARRAAHEARRDHAAILCGVGTAVADDPRLSVRLPGVEGLAPLRVVIDPTLRLPPSARLLARVEAGESAGPVLVATREGVDGEPVRASRARALRAAGAEILELPSEGAGLRLDALLAHLGEERRVNGLLVEGGGVTAGRFLAAGLGDALLAHVAPLVLGGGGGGAAAFAGFAAETLAEGRRLRRLSVRPLGEDLEIRGRLHGGFDPDALLEELEAIVEETG
jgi:diaminohydroxyphosphoribosylaminopyrimidine deaminase/5-amino-6-(5-phosphoribosylamino)uracil reductase